MFFVFINLINTLELIMNSEFFIGIIKAVIEFKKSSTL